MMNVKNFHLKQAFLDFDSQTLNNTLNKQLIKASRDTITRKLAKPSERIQTLMKNFKIASKLNNSIDKNQRSHSSQNHFDFQPPLLKSKRNKAKNHMSCTLQQKKSTQKLSSFQLYKLISKDNQHKRKFSDPNILNAKLQLKHRRATTNFSSLGHQNKTIENENKLTLKNQTNQLNDQNSAQQLTIKTPAFNKCLNKFRIFQIDDYILQNPDQKVSPAAKNSSFVTTLPTRKKSFRSAHSSNLRSDRINWKPSLDWKPQQILPDDTKINPESQENTKIQPYSKENIKIKPYSRENTKLNPQSKENGKLNPQSKQKWQDFKRSIQTAGTVSANRIDNDKLNLSSVQGGIFPQFSIWQKQQQFTKYLRSSSRPYKVFDKGIIPKSISKPKDSPCRPWSPGRRQNLMLGFGDQEGFNCLGQQ